MTVKSLGFYSALGLLLLASSSANAKVPIPDWESLLKTSRRIGIVRVERVESYEGVRVALATVLEPVAGLRRGQRIAYIAQPGWFWTCDSSSARAGETVLLCLRPIGKEERPSDIRRLEAVIKQKLGMREPLLAIAWAGLGCLEAKRRGGQWWITEPGFNNPPPEFTLRRKGSAVPLAAVREFAARVRAKRVPDNPHLR